MQNPNEPDSDLFGLTSSYDYEGSGSVYVSSGAEIGLVPHFEMEFPWQVEGFFQAEFTSSWNAGSSEMYWYRVEGECGVPTCDANGINYDDCLRTFFTLVAARSLSELCETLKAPSYTPAVNWKLKSIARYTRPALRENIVAGECNELEEQEFCQIVECLDYCVDGASSTAFWTVSVTEDVAIREMKGSISVSGTADTFPLRRKAYIPSDSMLEFGGSFDASFSLSHISSSNLVVSGSAELSRYLLEHLVGELHLSGYARTLSPSRSYSMSGGIDLSGSSKTPASVFSVVDIVVSGSSDFESNSTHIYSGSLFHFSSGSLNVGGSAERVSGRHEHVSSGVLNLIGEAYSNGLGLIEEEYLFETNVVSIAAEYPALPEVNTLTIDTASVTVSCGCGLLGQVLYATHNLSSSKVFGKFLTRNGLYLPYNSFMRYKSRDKSWRCVEHYSGFSSDGFTKEEWSLFLTLLCTDQTWLFTFNAQVKNRFTGKNFQTKFVLDIPASLICSDNNIATVIRADINTFVPSSKGVEILVVQSDRATTPYISPNKVEISVDGTYSDFVTYYDELGLFGDSYWQDSPFEIRINQTNRMNMQRSDLTTLITPGASNP